MENSNAGSFKNLIQDPSQLTDIINDPVGKGLAFFRNLSVKEQQYLIYAAGVGLIAYGFYLGKQGNK